MNKSIKTNTVFNIVKSCSTILFPLITFPYISRILQPENVGKVNFAQSFVNYFFLIATLGITTHAIRECAAVKENKEQLSNVASQLFSISFITTVFSYVILFITLIFFKSLESYRTLIIIESMMIIFTTLGADWLNSAMEDFKYITLRTSTFQLISLICIFLFVKTKDDYLNYAIISVLSSSGASITNIIYRRRYCKVKLTLNIDWKKHISPIFFLFVMMLSQTIFNNADTTMLGFMKGNYEVGLYSTAYKVTRIIAQIVQSLSYVVIPRLSVYFYNQDFVSANKLLRKILMFNITVGFPCVIGVEMLAKDIVYLVGGIGFEGAIGVIRVLILSFFFSLIGGSFIGNAILIPMKKEKYYMIVCIITAIVNVIMNFILVPMLGAIGASISTAFSGFLIMILLMMKIDKRINIGELKGIFIGPIFGCINIILICYICSFINKFMVRIAVTIILSAVVYIAILYVLKNTFIFECIEPIKNKIMNWRRK